MADLNKNKAMIPLDCSDVLYRQTTTGFSATNSTTIKNIDLSIASSAITATMRPFDLVGEFYINCAKATISYSARPSSQTYYLKCRLKFDSATTNRLQYIRFSFSPNVTFKNTGTINCKFGIDIYISINNTDKNTIRLESTNAIDPDSSYSTGIYKFIYDIENNTIESDIYE